MKIAQQLHLPLSISKKRQDAIVNSFGVQIALCASLDYALPIVKAANSHDEVMAALRKAEAFVAGFEGDELQEGIDELLAGIRAAIVAAEG